MTRPPVVVQVKPARKPTGTTTPKPHAEWLPKEATGTAFKGKPNPLAVAQHWLGTRLTERRLPDGSLGYFLDGTPADLTRLMRETNRALLAHGQEQLIANPAWRP